MLSNYPRFKVPSESLQRCASLCRSRCPPRVMNADGVAAFVAAAASAPAPQPPLPLPPPKSAEEEDTIVLTVPVDKGVVIEFPGYVRDERRAMASLGGRGLHSSTFQLSLSALYGIGGARRGCVARVKGVLGDV